MPFVPNYNPSPRWFAAHLFIKEALKIYVDFKDNSILTVDDLVKYTYFIESTKRAVRTLYGIAPVNADNSRNISDVENLMNSLRFNELDVLINHKFELEIFGYTNYGVPVISVEINKGDLKQNLSLNDPSIKEDLIQALNERKKIAKRVLDVLCDEFYDIYYNDKSYDIEYYSPLENIIDTDEIVNLILESGICKNKQEIYDEFGYKNDNGEWEVEFDFFSKYHYRYFQPLEKRINDDYFREVHSEMFYDFSLNYELENIKQCGF